MTLHSVGKHSKGEWRPRRRESDGQWMIITDASPLSIAVVTDFGGMPAKDNAYLLAAGPEAYDLATEIRRVLSLEGGREVSAVTRQEMEPIRKLAEQFLAKVEGRM